MLSIGLALTTVPSMAAGDAYFSLYPSSGSYVTGNSFTLNITETSSSGDNVQGVQAYLAYNSTYLRYNSLTLSGSPFTLCAQQTGGGGSVEVSCASSPNPVGGGTYPVAQVNFTVLAAGSTSISITSSSDIQNNYENSVWNGALTSASFTLSNPLPPPAPTSTSSPHQTSSYTPTPTSTPVIANKGGTTAPISSTAKNTPISTPTSTTIAENPPFGNITIIVTNSHGQPIANAKVIIDKTLIRYTNSAGQVIFSNVHTGLNTITIIRPGDVTTNSKLSIIAGNNKPVNFRLAKSFNSLTVVIPAIIILVLLFGGIGFWRFRDKHKLKIMPPSNSLNDLPIPITNNEVVMTSNQASSSQFQPRQLSPNLPKVGSLVVPTIVRPNVDQSSNPNQTTSTNVVPRESPEQSVNSSYWSQQ
jgi:hypothetical protein